MIDPFKPLGLTDSATEAQVKDAFRELSKTAHPDAGGTAEAFAELHQAYSQALELAGKPKLCFFCDGKKKIEKKGGFFKLLVDCPSCGGTGMRK